MFICCRGDIKAYTALFSFSLNGFSSNKDKESFLFSSLLSGSISELLGDTNEPLRDLGVVLPGVVMSLGLSMEDLLDLGLEMEDAVALFIGIPLVIKPKVFTPPWPPFDALFNCVGVATTRFLKSSSLVFPPEEDELEVFLP